MSKETPAKGLTRLHDLEAAEISLVPRGANRRKFLFTKSAKTPEEKPVAGKGGKNLADMIAKADPVVMGKVEEKLKAHNARLATPKVLPDPSTGTEPEQNPPLAPTEAPPVKKDGDEEFKPAVPPQRVGKDDGFTPASEPIPVAGTNVTKDNPTEMPLDDQAQAAVKAVVRILLPFKEQVSPLLLHEVLEAAGFQLTSGGEEEATEVADVGKGTIVGNPGDLEKAFQAIPARVESEDEDVFEGGVKKGHFHNAVAKANACYKEHMEKAGYKAYPAAEMAKKHDGSSVEKSKGEPVSKSGQAPDLSQVDPKTRGIIEDLYASNKETVQKNADLQKSIDALKAENRRKEIVQKASTFTHLALPQEEVVAALVDADQAGAAVYTRIEKSFSTLNEQAKASDLFGELGTSHPGATTGGAGGADNAWAQIEKLADGVVQKSAGTTKAAAIDLVLQTPEGKKLYGQHQAARGGV